MKRKINFAPSKADGSYFAPKTAHRWLNAIALSLLLPTMACADPHVPDSWKSYGSAQFELKQGLRLYYSQGSIIVYIEKGVSIEGHHPENFLLLQLEHADNAPKIFAGIRNETQARKLCELLITGGMIDDAKAYQALLEVHRAVGCEPLVKDENAVFEKFAKAVEGGYQVEFTAFHMPQTMGGESIVARYKFLVGKDASVKVETTPYIKGLALNWQTMMLETKEPRERERDAKAQARVGGFVRDCLALCPNKLPAMPKSDRGFSHVHLSRNPGVETVARASCPQPQRFQELRDVISW